MGEPSVDAFSSVKNKCFPFHWTIEDDAFKQDWNKQSLIWINHQFDLITKVKDKLITDKAIAILLVPKWTWSIWWNFLCRYCIESFLIKSQADMFLKQGQNYMKRPKWDVQAFYLDFRRSKERLPNWLQDSSSCSNKEVLQLYNSALQSKMLHDVKVKMPKGQGSRVTLQKKIPVLFA